LRKLLRKVLRKGFEEGFEEVFDEVKPEVFFFRIHDALETQNSKSAARPK
jgi:hypothetical protein